MNHVCHHIRPSHSPYQIVTHSFSCSYRDSRYKEPAGTTPSLRSEWPMGQVKIEAILRTTWQHIPGKLIKQEGFDNISRLVAFPLVKKSKPGLVGSLSRCLQSSHRNSEVLQFCLIAFLKNDPNGVHFSKQWQHRQPCHILQSRNKFSPSSKKFMRLHASPRHQALQSWWCLVKESNLKQVTAFFSLA